MSFKPSGAAARITDKTLGRDCSGGLRAVEIGQHGFDRGARAFCRLGYEAIETSTAVYTNSVYRIGVPIITD